MKRFIYIALPMIVIGLLVLVAACTGLGSGSTAPPTTQDIANGTTAGSAIGTVIGTATGQAGGAALGAVLGGLVGGLLVKLFGNKTATTTQVAQDVATLAPLVGAVYPKASTAANIVTQVGTALGQN